MKTLRQIADEIGVSKQAVYKRFKGKLYAVCSPYVHTNHGVVYLEEQGENLIKQDFLQDDPIGAHTECSEVVLERSESVLERSESVLERSESVLERSKAVLECSGGAALDQGEITLKQDFLQDDPIEAHAECSESVLERSKAVLEHSGGAALDQGGITIKKQGFLQDDPIGAHTECSKSVLECSEVVLEHSGGAALDQGEITIKQDFLQDDSIEAHAECSESVLERSKAVLECSGGAVLEQGQQTDLAAVLQATIDALQEQLEVKDRQIEQQAQTITRLTDALATAQQMVEAAQALHAGTMKHQLLSGEDGAGRREQKPGREQKRVWFSKIFGRGGHK